MSLYCVYRQPFDHHAPAVQEFADGLSLAEIFDQMHLPPAVKTHGEARISGHVIPRAAWHLVRPKATVRRAGGVEVANVICFYAPVLGSDDGGKNPLAILGGLALTVLSGGAASGLFATAGGLFTAGSTSALFLAGGISLIGSLLLNALVPPPSIDRGDNDGTQSRRDASARGNVLDPNGPVPRVVGQRRVFPPLAMEPLVTFDRDDEVVEAAYVLAGEHDISDIRVGAAQIDDIPGVQYEVREGVAGDRRLGLVKRYGRTEAVGQELRGHQVSAENGALLDPSVDVSLAVPQAQVIATRDSPDEHLLHIAFPQGLGRPSAPDDLLRVPLRLRIRRRGGSWRNLPELHFEGADFRQLRATIKLSWRAPEALAASASATKGFVAVYQRTEPQTAAPASGRWVADDYFYAGSGPRYANSNNLGSTGVVNYAADRHCAEFILDPSEFAPGTYEIEIRRGCAFRKAVFDESAYRYNGQVSDFFAFYGTPATIPFGRSEMADTVALQRSVSIWNEHPLPTDDFAVIGIRARNQSIERLSCVAGGRVADWDGSRWTGRVVTDNPAPHYRDFLVGPTNPDPLPLENLDDAGLVAWRAACASNGHTCNAVMLDTSGQEALTVIAGCGYARPYQSDVYGVVRDYDRSAEPVIQLYTPRNSANFSWAKAFPVLPDGLRVTYDDAAKDYEPTQVTVFRDGISNDSALTEQVRYEGVTTEADAIARARYDLAQLEKRSVLYTIDVGHDALPLRRGALVGLINDAVARNAGYGRVLDGGTSGVVLDTDVTFSNEPDVWSVTDIWSVADVWALGQKTQAQVRYPDGDVVTVDLDNATGTGDTLEFATVVDPVPIGSLVSTRVLAPEYRRMLVLDMQRKSDLTASLTLVDESPEIFA